MNALELLWTPAHGTTAAMPAERALVGAPELIDFVGGSLAIRLHADRPTLVANFVSTLDGVVSFGEPGHAGGTTVSGSFAPDRRLMGVLRTMADAVLLGAGTARGSRRPWIADGVDPDLTSEHALARRAMGLAVQPMTVIVSSSGDLDLTQPGLARPDVPVLVLTTERGQAALGPRASSERVQVVVAPGDQVSAEVIVKQLAARGCRLVVCEGGPHLLGGLVGAGAVDELFLTVAPQIAGRSAEAARLSLLEGQAFAAGAAPWSSLVSVYRAGSHLFLRYRFDQSPSEDPWNAHAPS